MEKERKPLNQAEKTIVMHMRRWPTLYPSSDSFMSHCVIGSTGSFYWKKGLLVTDENEQYVSTDSKGQPKFRPYPLQISAAVAQDLLHCGLTVFRSVSRSSDAPINHMPMHEDWQHEIGMKLFKDMKITPELYATTLEAFCIMQYGCRHNPHANLGHYQSEWEAYWKRIPHYEAELERIRRTKELGCVPPETFVGMGI